MNIENGEFMRMYSLQKPVIVGFALQAKIYQLNGQ
jgi:hypothetical protein